MLHLDSSKGLKEGWDLTLFGLGSTETINPQHYGEFKPRMSKPTAPICGTNKWERSFQHWELANPEQTSRFGEPRVTQRATGAAAACLRVHLGTATSSPLEQVRAPTPPSGIAPIGMGSFPSERPRREADTACTYTQMCTHQLPQTQQPHCHTQRRDRCLLRQIQRLSGAIFRFGGQKAAPPFCPQRRVHLHPASTALWGTSSCYPEKILGMATTPRKA